MNFSSLKLGIYDLLGLVIPGAIFISEASLTLYGWQAFKNSVNHLSGPALTVAFLTSFVLGHLIQESAFVSLKILKGPRFLALGRDEFWSSTEAGAVKAAISDESGIADGSVDFAFDYCLSRLGDRFPRRDVLVATADLSRSFLVLAVSALPAAIRISWDYANTSVTFVTLLLVSLIFLSMVVFLAWHRMNRFRRMSETAVFRAYLGTRAALKDAEGSLAEAVGHGTLPSRSRSQYSETRSNDAHDKSCGIGFWPR
jgi:hypothetical protein